ncbi:MFS transporter [Rhizobium glycinendophyticum]|uniref:MFS transporter n=1 Tax=Rhizobium glycinendophyticum TaxID=2589807 RepID=A0A504UBQ9_9HYPH|nr:MFS transporter [Rhizobium glycinendophyticum]TPP10700.1 MFS transporter [Rhizobium glycinendophyticum]
MTHHDEPGSGRLALYALPALPLAAIALPFYIVVPSFYADNFDISLAAIGALLLAIRMVDAVTDPLIGWLSDRVRSRYGRRRFFFAVSIPLTALSAFMLFWPPSDAGILYLALWGTALSLGATWSLLPYTAWGAELATGYQARVRLSGWRESATLIGSLLAITLPFLGGLGSPSGFHGLAWLAVFIVIALPMAAIIAVTMVPEPSDLSTRRLSMREGAAHLRRNGPFLRLVSAFLLNSFANAVPASLFIYFVGQRLGAPELQGPLLFTYFLCAVAGVPLAVATARRIGKHRAWCLAMLAACAIFSIAGFLGEGDVIAFAVVCVATGLLLGFDLTLPPAIQADVVDNDTVASGEQRSGLYFAAWSFVTKFSVALSAGIVFPLLDLAGFSGDQGVTQTPQAIEALAVLYAFLPILPKLAAIAIMWNFSLDEAEHRRLRENLSAAA